MSGEMMKSRRDGSAVRPGTVVAPGRSWWRMFCLMAPAALLAGLAWVGAEHRGEPAARASARQPRFSRETSAVLSLVSTADGRQVALGRADGRFRLLNPGGGSWVVDAGGPSVPVGMLAFAPDGQLLASSGGGATVTLWNPSTGERVADFDLWTASAAALAFAPDGQTLAIGTEQGLIVFWDVATRAWINQVVAHTDEVRCLAYAPDGRTLASGSADGSIALWDVLQGIQAARLLPEADRRVAGLAFAPDGHRLAFGLGATTHGGTGLIGLWSLPDGTTPRDSVGPVRILGPTHPVALAFSPDGRTLAVGGGNRVVELWDVATGHRDACLAGHQGSISALTFTPDGRTVVTGGLDTLVGRFDITPRS